MAQKYIEQYPVSDELRDAVAKWQYVLDALNDDPDQLDREIDWVIKRRMIRSYIERNDTTTTTDGPYAEAKEVIGGYFVIRAKDYAEAAEVAAGCPAAEYHRVDVRQIDFMGQPEPQ